MNNYSYILKRNTPSILKNGMYSNKTTQMRTFTPPSEGDIFGNGDKADIIFHRSLLGFNFVVMGMIGYGFYQMYQIESKKMLKNE